MSLSSPVVPRYGTHLPNRLALMRMWSWDSPLSTVVARFAHSVELKVAGGVQKHIEQQVGATYFCPTSVPFQSLFRKHVCADSTYQIQVTHYSYLYLKFLAFV